MKFSPPCHARRLFTCETIYNNTATECWCYERREDFTCKAIRAIFIKFSRINKLAFVGYAFIGLIFNRVLSAYGTLHYTK